MDFVTKVPGLHHISEQIFLELDHETISICQKVNAFWKTILDNPMFWLKKCLEHGLPAEYYLEWTKLIQEPKERRVEGDVT